MAPQRPNDQFGVPAFTLADYSRFFTACASISLSHSPDLLILFSVERSVAPVRVVAVLQQPDPLLTPTISVTHGGMTPCVFF
jgi:hypothetical protein